MKRLLCLLLVILCFTTTSFAVEDDHPLYYQAHRLHGIGLFSGTGTDQYGWPIYELNRAPTREMFALLNQQVTLKNSDMTINRSILNTMTKNFSYLNQTTPPLSSLGNGGVVLPVSPACGKYPKNGFFANCISLTFAL